MSGKQQASSHVDAGGALQRLPASPFRRLWRGVRLAFAGQSYLVLCWSQSFAGASSPPHASQGDELVGRYIQKIAVYGKVDRRQTEDEFASSHGLYPEELKANLSSTGALKCGKFTLSANITYRSDVITTAGHALFNPNNCEVWARPSECKFSYSYMGGFTTVAIRELVKTGLKCPTSSVSSADDWAVLRLAAPAKGPIPYHVRGKGKLGVRENQTVVSVANSSADFCLRNRSNGKCMRDLRTRRPITPMNVEYCKVREVYKDHLIDVLMTSDCDAGTGGSGGHY